jgi:hypothetical protein
VAGASRKPEIEEDLGFERLEWRAATVLFWVLLLLVAATLLGGFGNGPLSWRSESAPDGSLRLEYERFGRFGAPMRLTVHVRADAAGTASFTVSRDYLDAQRVQTVTPPPSSTEIEGDRVRYEFRSRGSDPLAVALDLQAVRRWSLTGEIRTAGQAVRFRQFIYP